MNTSATVPDLAKTDPRVKLIAAKIKKENRKPDALIEILHTAQNAYGYLPMNVLSIFPKNSTYPLQGFFLR